MDVLTGSAIDNCRKWLGLYLPAVLASCGQNAFPGSSSFFLLLHALFIKYTPKSNHSYRFGSQVCSLLGNSLPWYVAYTKMG